MLMKPKSIAAAVFMALVVVTITPRSVTPQAVELSTADRLEILYLPQITFAGEEPLIKIGLVEGVDSIRFSADSGVTVLPLGEGGAEIDIPEDTTFEVSVREGRSGTYAYAVVVAELPQDQHDLAGPLRDEWQARGYAVSYRQVGGMFAISGQQFDARRILLLVGETEDQDEAEALAEQLTRAHGIDSRVHAELDEYPQGLLTLSGLPGGIEIRNRDLLWVRGSADTVFTVRDVPYDRWMGGNESETRQYAGSMIFTVDRNGQLAVVNETTIERLVRGILPSEMYSDAPDDALRAQAVAARSELLADLGVRHTADPYMTCSDQRCQVYRGVGAEHSRMTRAVEATRGEILAAGDQVIKAYFSSNNGGVSGANSWTWGEEQRSYLVHHLDGPNPAAEWEDGMDADELREFLETPPDSYSDIARASNTFRWEVAMSGSELSLRLGERYPNLGPITDLEVLERGPSGRIARLRIVGTRGEATVERELNVRMALGGSRPLKSALFVLDIDRAADGIIEHVELTGGGFGHGVGLCQSGSVGMADRGIGYREILSNYYRGTEIRSLY
jgi:SpoIID/LytB domain protein